MVIQEEDARLEEEEDHVGEAISELDLDGLADLVRQVFKNIIKFLMKASVLNCDDFEARNVIF
jgi:hypothetical protein